MSIFNLLPLSLGLLLFSFAITSLLVVPFINLLYKFKLTRKTEGAKSGKKLLFDKLHDLKAGTPVGGGILVIFVVSVMYFFLFPFAARMGIFIRSSFDFRTELFIIFFTFISFGLLGLSDDLIKIFGKPEIRKMGVRRGLARKPKFVLQWCLGLFIGYILYEKMGIEIVHIPLFNKVIELGFWYVPFAAFVIVSFSNAFNITDGLDGLATGLLIICLTVFAVIAASSLDSPLSMFITLWMGALFAFLYFNIWPARVFLGDAGALSFGSMLGLIGLITGNLIALIIVAGLFIIEVSSSAVQILSYKFFKKPILPLAPLHNTFLAIGWEEPKIVMRAWLAAIILAVFGLWLALI